MDGRNVGRSAAQALVPQAQCLMTQLQTLVKDLPEKVEILMGRQTDVREIDRDNTLVPAAIIFMLGRIVVSCVGDIADTGVGETVRSQETPATPYVLVRVATSHESN